MSVDFLEKLISEQRSWQDDTDDVIWKTLLMKVTLGKWRCSSELKKDTWGKTLFGTVLQIVSFDDKNISCEMWPYPLMQDPLKKFSKNEHDNLIL